MWGGSEMKDNCSTGTKRYKLYTCKALKTCPAEESLCCKVSHSAVAWNRQLQRGLASGQEGIREGGILQRIRSCLGMSKAVSRKLAGPNNRGATPDSILIYLYLTLCTLLLLAICIHTGAL